LRKKKLGSERIINKHEKQPIYLVDTRYIGS
jgi:hypothetical protein